MLRLLPILTLVFKLWMAIDAGRRGRQYYWFLIIFFVPFGELIYFFVFKFDELRRQGLGPLFKRPPTLDELRYRYRTTPSVANRLALAAGFAAARKHAEAAQEYEGVLAQVKDDPEALLGLGVARATLGKREAAIEAFLHLVRVAPGYQEGAGWRALAQAQHEEGQCAEAMETLKSLVRNDPSADNVLLLAEYLLERNQPADARGMLAALVEDDRHEPEFVRRRNRATISKARKLLGRLASERTANA